MLVVEVNVPRYEYRRLIALVKMKYRDVVKEVSRSRLTGTIRFFIEECPRGWWLAVKLLRRSAGRLYIVREVKYIDIPSKVMELSMARVWKPEYEKIIEEELRKWGLLNLNFNSVI